MKRNIFICSLLLCCFAAVFISAVVADMNGKFSGNLIGPDGNDHPLTHTFKVDGDKLTGILETQEGKVPIDSGRVADNIMTFSIAIDGGTFAHKGTYYAQGGSIWHGCEFFRQKSTYNPSKG